MKIAFDAKVFTSELAGIGKSLFYLLEAIKKIDNTVEIVLFSEKPIIYNFNFDYKYIKVPSKMPFHIDKYLLNFMLRDCNYIHDHSNGLGVDKYWKKNKTTITIQDLLPLEIKNFFKDEKSKAAYIKHTQLAIDKAKIIFTISKYSKNSIKKYFNTDKEINIIPLGITIPELNNEINNDTENKNEYFIYVGGYSKRKGIEELLKAFISDKLTNSDGGGDKTT